ncbi:MAG: hypothetical protein E7158_05400 [Firmicutes bacterium]|nr:hypothetical protein [Bacillota bacterium]
MKKIKIAHLYYDLMNLYGENGNIRALEKYLRAQKLTVEINNLTIGDKIDFDKYDIFYIGSGNDEAFELTLKDIKNYKANIEKNINDKMFIITGNALNLFGKIYIKKKEIIPCLDILDFESKEIRKRIVGEQFLRFKKNNCEIIGFENRSSKLVNVKEKYLFHVIQGSGTYEGIIHKDFYGTYLLGPILVRNPYFTEYITKRICKKFDIKYIPVNNELEKKAYDKYKTNFLK